MALAVLFSNLGSIKAKEFKMFLKRVDRRQQKDVPCR